MCEWVHMYGVGVRTKLTFIPDKSYDRLTVYNHIKLAMSSFSCYTHAISCGYFNSIAAFKMIEIFEIVGLTKSVYTINDKFVCFNRNITDLLIYKNNLRIAVV